MRTIFSCILLVLFTCGCSVVAAVSGEYEPDMDSLQPGITRSEVRSELGDPIKRTSLRNGASSETYKYKLGDEPAPARAIMHLGLDIITLCMWEYIGFPMEISMSGNAYEMEVQYDRDNIATYFKIKDAPEEQPKQES